MTIYGHRRLLNTWQLTGQLAIAGHHATASERECVQLSCVHCCGMKDFNDIHCTNNEIHSNG